MLLAKVQTNRIKEKIEIEKNKKILTSPKKTKFIKQTKFGQYMSVNCIEEKKRQA